MEIGTPGRSSLNSSTGEIALGEPLTSQWTFLLRGGPSWKDLLAIVRIISSSVVVVEVGAAVVEGVSVVLKEVTVSVVEAVSVALEMVVSVLEATSVEETVVKLVSVPELVTVSVVTGDCGMHGPAEEPVARDMAAMATRNLWDTISRT